MDNYSKRRFYLNKKEQNSSYPASINPDKNSHKLNNIKLFDESHNRRYLGFNSNTSEVMDNIDSKNNYIRNRNDIGLNKLMSEKKANKYSFRNYQNNKDINCLNSSSINNKDYLNRTNANNSGHKYYDSLKKKSDYKTFRGNDNNLNNYIMSNYQKYNDNNSKYNDPKYNFKKTLINNYNYTKLFNQSYDYSQYNLFKNNIKEEKRYPVIVVQTKNSYISPNPNFYNYNKYSNRKKIIKIQSNWRGYFLRKIAVGSIKKYIGFVALMKYLEKIMDNNLRFLFLYVINLLRKYVGELKIRNKYRKNNNNEINNNRRRYRQFRYSPDINGAKNIKENQENNNENRNETKITKKNLFNADYDINGNDNFNGNNVNEKDKKGNNRYFVNKEKEREREKEERRKDEIERDKESERRRIEREERRKEQIEREKEFEKRRKERKEEKEKERKRKEEKEKEEKLRKEKEERIKKEKKEDNEINDDIFTKPLKVIYVPKRISGAKPLKSRLYFKRFGKDKNIKIEEFIKLITKKIYKINYPSFLYQLKIIRKSKIIELKLDSLYNIFKLIEIKNLKKYLKIYRDNVLDEKVKEEFLKKNMMKFKKMNQKYNNNKIEKKKENNNNEDKKENNLINEKKEKENKILEDKILENNKSEIRSIKEENENNNEDDINKIENEGNNEDDRKNENEKLNEKIGENNNDNLNKINLLKNNDNNDNNDNIINNEEIKKEDRKIKFSNNLHSPDMEIRGGNKSKKKYIKVKYSKAMTSKTSLGSIKSEEKSNNSLIQTKKMRIKNVVVNPSDYIANILIKNNSSLNNSIHNNIINTNSIKLINLIDKIESKSLKFKCFKSWKKAKNES